MGCVREDGWGVVYSCLKCSSASAAYSVPACLRRAAKVSEDMVGGLLDAVVKRRVRCCMYT